MGVKDQIRQKARDLRNRREAFRNRLRVIESKPQRSRSEGFEVDMLRADISRIDVTLKQWGELTK